MNLNDYSKLQLHLQDLQVDYDFIILDTPRDIIGLDEVLKNSNEVVIVHSPEHSSKIILDADAIARRHKLLNLGIVLNKSHEDSVNNFFDMPVIAKFADHEHVRKSFKLKHPVLHAYPKGKVSKEFIKLAKKLVV